MFLKNQKVTKVPYEICVDMWHGWTPKSFRKASNLHKKVNLFSVDTGGRSSLEKRYPLVVLLLLMPRGLSL